MYFFRMSLVGRLVGHNGTVVTMETLVNDVIATGSRDRQIKVIWCIIHDNNYLKTNINVVILGYSLCYCILIDSLYHCAIVRQVTCTCMSSASDRLLNVPIM